MDDWVRWVREADLPVLVRSAVGHYQFETIHPFFDGNGRLGRLLIVLQLLEEGKLSEPILEISTFLEDHRDEYQELLRRVSSTGDWNVWVGFFSEAVRSQSEQGLAKVDALLTYREEMMALLHENRVRGAAVQLADELIGSPVQVPARVADRLGITYQAALNSLERLTALGVLRRVDSSGRRRIYVAGEVLTILER